ncbi:GWT1-domain-containing protein [Xylariomycetidae sp. FL0641]|nr:GWT1-domain-containing protein [Xylariomycetidae sp. FL0641]
MESNPTSYKQMKEDFVSNLSGGSVPEINLVTAVGPISFLLWSVLQSRQSFFRPYKHLSYVVDFLLNVVAPLLAITLYADTPLLLSGLFLVPAIFVYALPPNPISSRKKPKLPPNAQTQKSPDAMGALPTKPFLTTYRGSMLVLTCLAILAVDFRIFPRRFAKVETWGTSLMDVGVGSFVFSAGVVAARPILKEKAEGRTTPLHQRLAYAMRHSLPLLVLGVIRLISVKGLDYAEHVTEYGVHWNFFFTLGFLPPFIALFQSALKYTRTFLPLALLLGVVYESVLESTSLGNFILIAPRTDLFSMNREGICSFFGYLAIFLAGQDIGMVVLPRNSNPNKGASSSSQRTSLLLAMTARLTIWSVLYFLTTDYSYGAGMDVSRRLANLPYILWIAAFNTAQLLACCLVETVFFPGFYTAADTKSEKEAYEIATSRVLRSFNRNGLAVFLLANLLTGLVNITVPTLDVTPVVAMGILVGYCATLTTVAVALDSWNLSIKL